MRSALEVLGAATKRRISEPSAYHSFYRSQESLGQTVEIGSRYDFHRKEAPLLQLVKIHPATGRKSLFVGRHIYPIPSMKEEDAIALRDELIDHACHAPRILRHTWSEGDMVLWDNHCVVHRVNPYDYSQPRIMRHTRVAGDPTSEGTPTSVNEQPANFVPKAR